MRVWDIEPGLLCRSHLLGEHREIHAIWNILNQGKIGYSNHPETLRWKGKLNALYARHEMIVREMIYRGYNHHSPLDQKLAIGAHKQTEFVNPIPKQISILKRKGCGCRV